MHNLQQHMYSIMQGILHDPHTHICCPCCGCRSISPYISLHTRIGTSDSIESNASSFMVEMADMARLMGR
jgi:hypothetical protein